MKAVHTLPGTGLFFMVLLSMGGWSSTETVRLKTGAVLVGEVEVGESGKIIVHARFPEERVVTLDREELAPWSLYEVLSRRADPGDFGTRLELARMAEAKGLYGLAITDYLAIAERKPELAEKMTERVEHVRELLAQDLLDHAISLREEGNPRAALMYLHTLAEDFGKTPAAREGEELMGTTHELAGLIGWRP